LLNIHGQLC